MIKGLPELKNNINLLIQEVKQLRELIAIRDRKIELQAKEIELLKKLLAGFQNGPRCDSGQDKWPAAEIEPVWVGDIPIDRLELETDEYPKYDELTKV